MDLVKYVPGDKPLEENNSVAYQILIILSFVTFSVNKEVFYIQINVMSIHFPCLFPTFRMKLCDKSYDTGV